jgi:predicted transcriptional regulator
LIIARLTHVLDELADAGAEVRRAEAAQLKAEGLSQGAIAKIFG